MPVRKHLILLLCLYACVATNAQNNKPANKQKTAPAEKVIHGNPKSLLWEVSGKGLTAPSYLYGTMHMVCAEDTKMSEGLKAAIKKAKQVYFEIDMDNMEEMMSVLKYARMTNGLKISDLLSTVDYQKLQDYFNNNKSALPFGMLSRFKPYFITAIISEGIMGCKTKVSVEQLIMAEARQHDKEVNGLETLEFQASIFDSIPYEKQAEDLVMYVDSINKFKQITMEMVEMYRKQDIDNMDSLMEKSDPGMMQYMDLLLFDRNKRWASQIPEKMFNMSTLFAVGAGHLGGEKGVINLLKQQGFTVKPLDNTKFVDINTKTAKSLTL
ncbi:MAG TPA: TraB/GumN family protein [Flavitalea sp.]|nr:TraB/GumN family protein [Flavitalea sp.]